MPSEELPDAPTDPPLCGCGARHRVHTDDQDDDDLENDDDPQDVETLIAQRDMWQDRARTAEAQLKRKEPTRGDVVQQAAARFQAELDRSAGGLSEAFANIDAMLAADDAAYAAKLQRRQDEVALYVHTWFGRNFPSWVAAAEFANEIMAIVRSYDGHNDPAVRKDERS